VDPALLHGLVEVAVIVCGRRDPGYSEISLEITSRKMREALNLFAIESEKGKALGVGTRLLL
jgi:hypothetical protein